MPLLFLGQPWQDGNRIPNFKFSRDFFTLMTINGVPVFVLQNGAENSLRRYVPLQTLVLFGREIVEWLIFWFTVAGFGMGGPLRFRSAVF